MTKNPKNPELVGFFMVGFLWVFWVGFFVPTLSQILKIFIVDDEDKQKLNQAITTAIETHFKVKRKRRKSSSSESSSDSEQMEHTDEELGAAALKKAVSNQTVEKAHPKKAFKGKRRRKR